MLFGLGIALAFIFIGFGFTKNIEVHKEYQRAMDRGEQAVKKMNYQAAQIDFQDALKRKRNDAQATRDLKQLNTYLKAKKQLDQKKYEDASDTFKEVATENRGLNILVRRATAYQTEIENSLDELQSFNKLYQKAVELNNKGDFIGSNQKLAPILEYHHIDQEYYDNIRQKAKSLKEVNDDYLK